MNDDFDEADSEVHISITAREDVLERLGLDMEAFEASLSKALDEYLDVVESFEQNPDAIPEDTPSIDDVPITFGDRTFRLNELADVEISESSDFDESE